MTINERLMTLEQELSRAKRRSRWLLAMLGLGLGAVALVWASAANVPRAGAQDVADGRTVRANKFVLENADGKIRAMLFALKDGASLNLIDENGTSRIRLAVVKDGSVLSLFDETGTPRAGLTVTKGGPGLVLNDENGTFRAILTVVKDGPRLRLSDEAGKSTWSTP